MRIAFVILLGASFFAACGNNGSFSGQSSGVSAEATQALPASPHGVSASPSKVSGPADAVRFIRTSEPRENAFSLLIPHGWIVEGGILRINPLVQGGPTQSIEAKLDFAIKKDQAGTVMMKWVPELMYMDMRFSPAGQMGLYPPGSNYMGMTVWPKLSALEFLKQATVPQVRPYAQSLHVEEARALPDVARGYQQFQQKIMPGISLGYDAGLLIVSYQEAEIQFKEAFFTAIEDYGYLIPGGWKNKSTFSARAPLDEFKQWEPVAGIILRSVRLIPQWVTGEIRGQITRGEIAADVIRDVNRIGQEIADHQSKTNAEINNDAFLTLTEQEEYLNPFTNEVEVGSNQWEHRWTNPGGDVIYTDSEYYDPNTDANLNRSDFKRTPIRPRFPE